MNSLQDTKFQLAILAEGPDGLEGLSDTASIEWLFCKQTGNQLFDFYKDHAMVSAVNLENARFDLQNLVGIIVVGSIEKYEAVQSEWRTRLPSASVTFRQASKNEHGAILCAAVECIAAALTSQRRHSGRAALELATYRREFERLQRNFTRVEEYVGRQSFQRPNEIFEYPPDAAHTTETGGLSRSDNGSGPTGHSVSQYIPVDSLGLSSISIHVAAKPEPSAQPLLVKLKAVETGKILATWSIPAVSARAGWIELALSHAIDEPALSLILIVELQNTTDWILSLGPPHPYREFCAHNEKADSLSAPLSMQLFSGLPGVRVSATTTAIRPLPTAHVAAEFVPYELYQHVTQVSPPVHDGKPVLVSYDAQLGCITVHPQKSMLTIARIPIAAPKNAWGLTAQIHLANEKANPTQFGMILCPPRDENRELGALDRADTVSKAFSGWRTLSPLEKKSISVVLPTAPEERLTLYLVTRQSPELSPDFAWARFSELAFNILPQSLKAAGDSVESAPVTAPAILSDKETAIEPAKG